jgi:hypothetical protein
LDNTKVTIAKDRGFLYHGSVKSEAKECMDGRRVILFKQGRKVGTTRADFGGREGVWGLQGPRGRGWYAKVRREVHDEFVCRGDRTATKPLNEVAIHLARGRGPSRAA